MRIIYLMELNSKVVFADEAKRFKSPFQKGKLYSSTYDQRPVKLPLIRNKHYMHETLNGKVRNQSVKKLIVQLSARNQPPAHIMSRRELTGMPSMDTYFSTIQKKPSNISILKANTRNEKPSTLSVNQNSFLTDEYKDEVTGIQ